MHMFLSALLDQFLTARLSYPSSNSLLSVGFRVTAAPKTSLQNSKPICSLYVLLNYSFLFLLNPYCYMLLSDCLSFSCSLLKYTSIMIYRWKSETNLCSQNISAWLKTVTCEGQVWTHKPGMCPLHSPHPS